MQEQTPPSADAAEFPASTRSFKGDGQVEVPVRTLRLGGHEPALELYDTSGPRVEKPGQGLPKLRQPWLDGRCGGNVTQLYRARRARSPRRCVSWPCAKTSRPKWFAPK